MLKTIRTIMYMIKVVSSYQAKIYGLTTYDFLLEKAGINNLSTLNFSGVFDSLA